MLVRLHFVGSTRYWGDKVSVAIPSLGEIKRDLKPKKLDIWLAKPNKQIIAKLSEAYNISQTLNFGGIHEVTFTLPFTVEKEHKQVRNAHVDMVRGHFLLKVDKEWYVLNQPSKSASDGKEVLEITAYLLPYMLRNKMIRAYEGVKKPSEVLGDVLEGTNWKVGYIDSTFELKYRSFEIPEATTLDCVNQIAETFGGVVVYDTDKQTVSLYRLDLLGVDKGLSIAYGKYLKAIREEPNFDEVCTRLYLYGKDGLTIRGVNPTGTAYIEDLSYYMHPYNETITDAEQDTYTVTTHSHYMSDELCHALIKYRNLLEQKSDEFSSLLTQKSALQGQLIALEDEVYHLETELEIILDNLDTWYATKNGQANTELVGQRNAKEAEVAAKRAEINAKNHEIASVLAQIDDLGAVVAVENNFTSEQLAERANFIFERKWENEFISDPEDLLDRGKEEIVKMSQPHLAYTIDIVDFLKVVECQRDWDKLRLGDVVTVRYPNFGIDIKAKIITITHDHDSNSIVLEIANTRDIKSGFLALQDVVRGQISTSTMIDMYKHKWDLGEEAKSQMEQFIDNAIDANKQAIKAGVNETYTLDRRGLTMKDPNDPSNYLRALHNILAFTNDGGNTFKHAITPTGIVGEYIYGKVIAGVNLTIENTAGSFRVDSEGVTVTDADFSVTRSDGRFRTQINATHGFKMQAWDSASDSYVDKLWADLEGNLHINDLVARRVIIEDGSGNVLIDGVTGKIDFSSFSEVKMSGAIIWDSDSLPAYSWDDLSGDKPPEFTYIDSRGIYTGTLSASQINAGKISADFIDTVGLSVEKIIDPRKEDNILRFSSTSAHWELFSGSSSPQVWLSITGERGSSGPPVLRFANTDGVFMRAQGAACHIGDLVVLGNAEFQGTTTGIVATFG